MGNNLNEEIRRIKTLFTEERLYGNLVEQETISKKDTGTLNLGSDDVERVVDASKIKIKKHRHNGEVDVTLTLTQNYTPNDFTSDRDSKLNNVPKNTGFVKINGDTIAQVSLNNSDGKVSPYPSRRLFITNGKVKAELNEPQSEFLALYIIKFLQNIGGEDTGKYLSGPDGFNMWKKMVHSLSRDKGEPKSDNVALDTWKSLKTTSRDGGNTLIDVIESFPDLDNIPV